MAIESLAYDIREREIEKDGVLRGNYEQVGRIDYTRELVGYSPDG